MISMTNLLSKVTFELFYRNSVLSLGQKASAGHKH